ncbi:ParB/RepB/Spo0J family partition protein [Mangrovicoccus algicola]|uniref:ParB N-terminal domain-containing protein n=1 Tax=Mangrovicoccus algicola TaxID=2771008 RepID=A0A8J7CUV0_9RHOB|nr:ParB N-terminal domain-containing protein [Mangrovicoccus algicola]MBE3637979.1 ParB N-terminal domain-containing protein [Mangrovicoccus algicola]
MSRKRLGSIDRDTIREMREGAEKSAAERRDMAAGMAPPIGKVAGSAAAQVEEEIRKLRRENSGLRADSETLAGARDDGRVVELVPLERIDLHALARDRRMLDRDGEAWAELKGSIAARGQQVPVELGPEADGSWRLISGYRRVSVLRELYEETGDPKFSQVRALIRSRRETLGDMLAMIEENEIRQDVSFYERGRICCLAAEQGICDGIEEAIQALFPNSSRNRRYKIRNFTVIHAVFGPYLDYPEAIGERLGARLAQAVKDGREAELIAVLSDRDAKFPGPAEELAVLEAFVAGRGAFGAARPDRPAPLVADWQGQGVSIRASARDGKLVLTLEGCADLDEAGLRAMLERVGSSLQES